MAILIFDLDGTLSDPAVGIGRCINHALSSLGYPEVAPAEVSAQIGPQVDLIFRRFVGSASEITIRDLIARYRERYAEIGYAENTVYPGIPEALRTLSASGVSMGICTAKRADFAERILEHFHLRQYFAFVDGGEIGVTKEAQLRGLLAAGTIAPHATMIGDRAADVNAARSLGLRAVGVLWGYGSRDELSAAGADRLLESPDQLQTLPRTV